MVQYPTTPVNDGAPRPQIPTCVQRLSGLWYCYDDQGNLTYIGSSPQTPQLKTGSQINLYTNTINIPSGNALSIAPGVITMGYFIGNPYFGAFVYGGSVSVPVGTSNTYGSTVTVYNNACSTTGYYLMLFPVLVTVTWGGTFASGETVTVKLTFNLSVYTQLNTSAVSVSTTLSATAAGSQSLNFDSIVSVIAPAVTNAYVCGGNAYKYYFKDIQAAAASSATSTSVTVAVQAWFVTS